MKKPFQNKQEIDKKSIAQRKTMKRASINPLLSQGQGSVIQSKHQELVNNSPQVKQLQAIQEMAAKNNPVKNVLQKKSNNTGLPNQLKSGIENLSGISMDDVKVHYNSPKPAQLQAHAYAQGTNIHLASGQEKHLPHEAWHVVQQKQGRVKPTMQMKGKVNINDEVGLEREADVMGAKAMQMKGKGFAKKNVKANRTNLSTLQRVRIKLPHPDRNNHEQWTVDIAEHGKGREHLHGWINAAVKNSNLYALEVLRIQLSAIPNLSRSEENALFYARIMIAEINNYLRITVPPLLKQLLHTLANTSANVLSLAEQLTYLNNHLPRSVSPTVVRNFLNEPDIYTVATIANAKAKGALGHHIFIQFSDETISEYAGPATKAKYPKSQSERRRTTRAQVARLKMAARKHGFKGKPARYYMDSPINLPKFRGYLYFPWYQDCFHWVDAVLADAGEPPEHLVRIKKGHVGMWGGILVLAVGAGAFAAKSLGGGIK